MMPSGETQGEPSQPLFRSLAAVLRRPQLLGYTVLGFVLPALALAFALPARYTSVASFVPETRSTSPALTAGVAAIANQVGLPLGTEPSQSPNFYASLVTSQTLLEQILLQQFPSSHPLGDSVRSTSLLDFWRIRSPDQRGRLDKGIRRLRSALGVTADVRTNIVRLEVQTEDPTLSANVANAIVQALNDFNENRRRSQARERRRFVEGRVADAQTQLTDAESTLRDFYARNRQFREAPELVFREAQLRRQVDVAQELYLSLRRELESARIQEVNDTPVLTVIDSAAPAARRSFPNRQLFLAVGFTLGVAFGVLACVLADAYVRLITAHNVAPVGLRERLVRVRAALLRH
jgi:uncharacterized protein involved in exopolysaccharide biosynthesis